VVDGIWHVDVGDADDLDLGLGGGEACETEDEYNNDGGPTVASNGRHVNPSNDDDDE
jgi:hypothetical protein